MPNVDLTIDTPSGPIRLSGPLGAPGDEDTVTLVSFGGPKVEVIKVVRALTGLPLKEAKDMVDNLPWTYVPSESTIVPQPASVTAIVKLQRVGATVERSRGPEQVLMRDLMDLMGAYLGNLGEYLGPQANAVENGS
jgi:hypothetical protein